MRDLRSYAQVPPKAVHWTRGDQSHVWVNYHFRIVIDDQSTSTRIIHKAKIDVSPLLQHVTNQSVERLIAKGSFQGAPILAKAYDFIRQQNIHGYRGAWERGCGNPAVNPGWLRATVKRALKAPPKPKRPVGRPPKLNPVTRLRSNKYPVQNVRQ